MPATGASPPAPQVHELHAGALRLALRPDLGGCIAGLWHDGTPVLRSVEPAALSAPRAGGCFPLVPYSNRLGYRRFRWKGQDHTTEPNFDGSPHSLHGVAWTRPWSVLSSNAVEVVLGYLHRADAHWPFDFEVRQYVHLTPRALHMQMVFVNEASTAQPVGLGWHPYFPKRERSRMHLELTHRWDGDGAQLPVRKVAQPGIDSAVAHLAFDHCFEGWRGPARLRDERYTMLLSSSLPYVIVYTPQDKDYYCVEPVSHLSNAIHMADPAAHGLRAVEPGDRLEAWMQLEVSPA